MHLHFVHQNDLWPLANILRDIMIICELDGLETPHHIFPIVCLLPPFAPVYPFFLLHCRSMISTHCIDIFCALQVTLHWSERVILQTQFWIKIELSLRFAAEATVSVSSVIYNDRLAVTVTSAHISSLGLMCLTY